MKTRIHHFAIGVKDLKRSINFYCGILGLSIIESYSWKNGDYIIDKLSNKADTSGNGIIIGSGNAFFELIEHNNSSKSFVLGTPAHLCVYTEDIEKLCSKLSDNGITIIEKPYDTKLGTFLAWIQDPDGNLVELLEIYSASDNLNFDFNQ